MLMGWGSGDEGDEEDEAEVGEKSRFEGPGRHDRPGAKKSE